MVVRIFTKNNIRILRIGLSANESLTSNEIVYGGANHPAIGELIYSEFYYELLVELLTGKNIKGSNVVIYVNKGELSRAIGHKKKNKLRLIEMFSLEDIRFKETILPEGVYVSIFEDNLGFDERII